MNPRIVSIKKENKRYTLKFLVDNEFVDYRITEELLIEMKFLSAKEISASEYNLFLSKLPLDSLYYDAIKYTSKHLKSKKEVRDYLFNQTSSSKLIDEVLERLEKQGIIDDYSYFKTLLDYLINTKMEGRLKIEKKLADLGLNYSFNYPITSLKTNIKNLSTKYDIKNRDLPIKRRIEKCKIYLYQKGYSENDISEYFSLSFFKKTGEEHLLDKEIEKAKEKAPNDINKIKFILLKKGYSLKDIEEKISELS